MCLLTPSSPYKNGRTDRNVVWWDTHVHGPNTTDLSGTNSALCQSLAIWLGFLFLYLFSARYTLLARYRPVLSSCVRPSVRLSVCPSVTSRHCIGTTGQIELVSAWWLPSTNPALRCTEIWVSPKIRVFPSGTLSLTPDFENFATTSRSRCQQHSPSSSTVELVDDTYIRQSTSCGCLLQAGQL